MQPNEQIEAIITLSGIVSLGVFAWAVAFFLRLTLCTLFNRGCDGA